MPSRLHSFAWIECQLIWNLQRALLWKRCQLASILATRLSYATWKVSHGWIQQNITEVENLYSSRFRAQAEQRAKPRTDILIGKSRRTEQDLNKHGLHHGTEGISDEGGILPEIIPIQGSDGHYPGPFATRDAPAYPYRDQELVQLTTHTDLKEHPLLEALSPPVMQPSPSMYSYLASPVIVSNMAMSPNLNGTPVRVGTSARYMPAIPAVSEDSPRSYTDFWKNTSDYDGYSSSSRDSIAHRNGFMAAGHQAYDAMYHIPKPAMPSGSAAGYASSAELLPPVGIVPKVQASASDGIYAGRRASINNGFLRGSFGSPLRRHQASNSQNLRGEYSASNVTMDDLDSHFGSV